MPKVNDYEIPRYILNKSENATLLLLVKMAEKRFLLQYLFGKIKCLTSSSPLDMCMCFEQIKAKEWNFHV